jgi:hypothetical protein
MRNIEIFKSKHSAATRRMDGGVIPVDRALSHTAINAKALRACMR